MDKKTILVGAIALLTISIITAAAFLFSQPVAFRGTTYGEPYPPAPEIELTRTNGEDFHLADQKGDLVLLFFGYISCIDVCPTTMAQLKLVMDDLGDASDSVKVVFVTVDPERDTPDKLQSYIDHFSPDFIGLSGSAEKLEKVWKDYGVYREVVPAEEGEQGYSVDHVARIALIDADGNLRLSYGYQAPVDDIVHDIKLLLK